MKKTWFANIDVVDKKGNMRQDILYFAEKNGRLIFLLKSKRKYIEIGDVDQQVFPPGTVTIQFFDNNTLPKVIDQSF